MRSSWAARALLPLAQLLAEGGWLAVVYAAARALGNATPFIGPLELALLAGIGMAFARRRWGCGPRADQLGLLALALVGGAAGWLLAPDARGALLDGGLRAALGTHVAGWLAGIAVLRGAAHGAADEGERVQQRLLRLAVPGLAVPWLVGQVAATGAAEREFTAAAFMGTLIFTAAAFTALGLAHLETARLSSGTDWRRNRSWLALVGGVALATTLAGIPASILLGVPASALLVALFGPLRVLFLVLLVLVTPLVVLAAWVASLLPIDPGSFAPPLEVIRAEPVQAVSDAPAFIFYAVVAVLLVIELLFLGAILYLRWQERRRFGGEPEGFEERSIVIGGERPARRGPAAPRPRRRLDPDDPADAYLLALDLLERDGRWRRDPAESPAAHALRLAGSRPHDSLARLAAAYQLVRYGGVELARREARRGRHRLERLRSALR